MSASRERLFAQFFTLISCWVSVHKSGLVEIISYLKFGLGNDLVQSMTLELASWTLGFGGTSKIRIYSIWNCLAFFVTNLTPMS